MSLSLKVKRGFTVVDGVPFSNADLNAGFLPIITLEGTIGTTDLDPGVIHKEQVTPDAYWYADDSDAGANVLVATYAPAPDALEDGLLLAVKVQTANSGAVTFNPNGLGAKPVLKYHDQALAAGDLEDNMIIEMRYDAEGDGGNGAWQLLTPVATSLDSKSPEFTSSGINFVASTSAIKVVYTGGVVGWTEYAGATDILAGKKAAILQIVSEWPLSTDGKYLATGRPQSGGIELVLARFGATDAVVDSTQVILPIQSDGTFDYKVELVTSDPPGGIVNIAIQLIGYIG